MKYLFLSLIVIVLSCNTESEVLPKNQAEFHEKNPMFIISFPTTDWKLVNQQGIDSYVGYYDNGTEKIYFDYGRYGRILDGSKALYYEEFKLKKCACTAVISKESRTNGIVLSALIYKQDKPDRTVLYVWNPEDDEKFISIFKTHLFK